MCKVVYEPFSQTRKNPCVPNYAFQNQKKKEQTRALQPRHAPNFYEPFVVLCAPRSLSSLESQHVIDFHDAFQITRTSNFFTQMKIKNAISNLNVNYFLKSPNPLLLPAPLCSLDYDFKRFPNLSKRLKYKASRFETNLVLFFVTQSKSCNSKCICGTSK